MIIYNDNFTRFDDDYEDYIKEFLAEDQGVTADDISDDAVLDYIYTDLDIEIDCVRAALKSIDTNTIYCVADLGLWDGRVQGYKTIDSLDDFTTCCEDYNTLETDRYNLTLTAVHHDGTNYITFRELKDDLSDEQIERFEDKLYNGTCTHRDLTRYTRSLKKKVDRLDTI